MQISMTTLTNMTRIKAKSQVLSQDWNDLFGLFTFASKRGEVSDKVYPFNRDTECPSLSSSNGSTIAVSALLQMEVPECEAVDSSFFMADSLCILHLMMMMMEHKKSFLKPSRACVRWGCQVFWWRESATEFPHISDLFCATDELMWFENTFSLFKSQTSHPFQSSWKWLVWNF